MAKRVIDDSTLTAIADEIRNYLMSEDKYSPDEMPQAIYEVFMRGNSDGFAAGVAAGYSDGYQAGKTEAKEELSFQYSTSLSEALTSGDLNTADLETNVNQAKADIGAIKTLIENHGAEVPVGTPSSTYDETLEQIMADEKAEGVKAGIEQGKQAQYDEFWDAFQQNGNRADYNYAFVSWHPDVFYPKYDIKSLQGRYMANMFYNFGQDVWGNVLGKLNLTERLKECNVRLDTTGVSSFGYFMTNKSITHIPEIVTTSAANLQLIFYYARALQTVEKLVLKADGTQTFGSSFDCCDSLENISIEGVIGQNFNMQWSPLTKESITSVINALSTTATGKTLTLKKTAVEAAFPWICAYSSTWDDVSFIDWKPVAWAKVLGEDVEVGEYAFISLSDTNIVIQKTGVNINPDGADEGTWTLIAQGADVTNEWGDLIASKSNWTISLV